MSRMASSVRRGRGPERRTTGVPAPIISPPLVSLAARLLLLSRWSRETGLGIVVARGAAGKRPSLRRLDLPRAGRFDEEESWMPDEDSNLD